MWKRALLLKSEIKKYIHVYIHCGGPRCREGELDPHPYCACLRRTSTTTQIARPLSASPLPVLSARSHATSSQPSVQACGSPKLAHHFGLQSVAEDFVSPGKL
jgi:hypothetical protein